MKYIYSMIMVLLSLLTTSISAADYKLTLAVTTPENSPWGATLSNFKQLAEEYTEGKVEIQASYGGALGNDTQLLQKAQLGSSVQGASSSGANLGSVVNAFKVFDIPFLIKDVQEGIDIFYSDGRLSGELVDKIQPLMAKKNLRLLYVTPFEFRGILTTSKGIHSPDDMKGLKIRVTPSDVERNIMTSLGSGPTTLGISEVYTALQTGTVDGLAIPPITATTFALHEVSKYMTVLDFQPHGSFMTVNSRVWNRLPKDIQQQLQKAADDAVQNTRYLFDDALVESMAKFKEQGVNVIEVSDEQKSLFAEKIQDPSVEVATKTFNNEEKEVLNILYSSN